MLYVVLSLRKHKAEGFRMAAFRFIALMTAVFATFTLNASGEVKTNPRFLSKIKALATVENTDQATFLITNYIVFSIFDEKFASKTLAKAPDYVHFRDRVNDWMAADSSTWNLIKTHLDYCNQLRLESKLGTDIDSEDPDIRWIFFLAYGEPSNVLVLPCRCTEGDGACSLWTYTWLPTETDQPGDELSCRSRPNMSFPTTFVPNDDAGFLNACPIWPMVNCSQFPVAGGMADVWFSVWVPGNQFTRPTLDTARLKVEVEIFDSSRTLSVMKGSSNSELQTIRGLLEATNHQDRFRIRAMDYIGFANVRPGSYSAHVTIVGARNNDGDAWLDFEISAVSRTSDLLILKNNAAASDNTGPGIIRGTRSGLYDNPEATFARGEKLNLYVESELPRESKGDIEVWATLLPIPEIQRSHKAKVTTGASVVVADSLDNPILSDKWQTPDEQKLLENLARSHSDAKAITLLRKRFDTNGTALQLELAPRLNNDLKTGKYLLTVTISDPKHKSDILTARRIIKVAPGVTNVVANRFRTFGQ